MHTASLSLSGCLPASFSPSYSPTLSSHSPSHPPSHSSPRYEERIGSLVTVLLALFAFLNFARATLPDVPIPTWLDGQVA